ncbi:MAG: DUF4124 domain-containing protein [Rhodocyclaceae bacterium]|jgi:hypothetical protein|nr:DUF4124 domain-containing protein [Rhodocyclaceae bacterium]
MRLLTASPILLILLPFATAAQVYSWKDASGKVHYGDRPPAERQVQVRQLPAAPSATGDAEAARKAAAERQFAQREKQAGSEAGQTPEDPAQTKIRAENCQRAKSTLAALESGQIRFTLNEKGERVALDGQLREEELARARKAVADWCSPPAGK